MEKYFDSTSAHITLLGRKMSDPASCNRADAIQFLCGYGNGDSGLLTSDSLFPPRQK